MFDIRRDTFMYFIVSITFVIKVVYHSPRKFNAEIIIDYKVWSRKIPLNHLPFIFYQNSIYWNPKHSLYFLLLNVNILQIICILHKNKWKCENAHSTFFSNIDIKLWATIYSVVSNFFCDARQCGNIFSFICLAY